MDPFALRIRSLGPSPPPPPSTPVGNTAENRLMTLPTVSPDYLHSLGVQYTQTLLTFVLASLVNAVDICAWSNIEDCTGTAVCCGHNPEHSYCTNIPAGFVFSVQYTDLPGPISFGQAWTSTDCVAGRVSTDQVGSGTKCYASACNGNTPS
ncbi:hypothetical protein B0H14DRAFT_3462683 [Mycena olivaceomarginata]|nr:hypothetical protein B0H14DRAFT_3462683 [Mycena olivaceomarginata]